MIILFLDPGFTLSPVKPALSPGSEHSLVFSNTSPSQAAYSPSSSHWSSFGHVTPTNAGSFTGPQSYASPGASFLSVSGGQASLDRVGHSNFLVSDRVGHSNILVSDRVSQ